MADRAFTPVLFALEKNLVNLAAHVTFGASGAPTLDSPNSLGFYKVSQFSTSFTATGTSTTSITGVSNFTGLYNGMILSGTNVAAGSVISAINAAAGTFTLSIATTGAISAVTATGGYVFQLGKSLNGQASLDPYNKLLGASFLTDYSGAQGAAATAATAPSAAKWFMTSNTIASATAGTGASLTFMCGEGSGSSFVQAQPVTGTGLYLKLTLGNSTAK